MPEKCKILIANGVNLDLLGKREQEIYGSFTLKELETLLNEKSKSLAQICGIKHCDLTFFQSNDESKFLDILTKGWHGALINAGAWTHTSIALRDRLSALQLPFVEIHISNLARRESFRQQSYLADIALGSISGLGMDSYLAGLVALLSHLGTPG